MERPRNSISELDELRLIYYEILDGRSFDAKSSLYVKHFSDEESHLILRKRIELFDFYSSEGVPHESELLKSAIKNEEWSQEKENRILELKYAISDNEKNLPNIIQQQRPFIEGVIQKDKDDLADILFDRKHTLGRNIEDLIDEDANDYIIYLSFFKDRDLTVQMEKTYDEFQNWEPSKINELNAILSVQYSKFVESKIKGIACLPMFLNKFSYSKDDIYTFMNKPISKLTHHQNFLFSLGQKNLSTLGEANASPPDLNLDAKISDLISWYDLQHSLNITRRKRQE